MHESMKLHAALARALRDRGLETMFGLIGDGNLFFANSFTEQGGTFVAAANESGALAMANGYSAVSGRIAVATVTHGPGLTNVMTPLVEGVRDASSVLLIAADTAEEDIQNLQQIDQREHVKSTGAAFEQVRSPGTMLQDLSRALRRIVSESRPVVLNVPADFQWMNVEYEIPQTYSVLPQDVAPDPAALDTAVGVIASARRPLILAGKGATSPAARSALVRLGERIGAPLATTVKAKDLFRYEPYSIGISGTLSTSVATDVVLQSDCIVAFGASLNKWTTASGSLVEGTRVVHCDIDPRKLGALCQIDAGVVGDTAVVAATVCDWLDQADVPASHFRTPEMAQRLAEPLGPPSLRDEGNLDLRVVLQRIDEVVPRARTFVTDGGRFIGTALRQIHVEDPSRFILTVNFGSIGLGMGASIGAAVALQHQPTLLVTGDGGFMLGGLGEFSTAVRNDLDLIAVVVCNDGSYGAEHVQYCDRGMDPRLALFDWPDFAEVARAMGGDGMTIRTPGDLDLLPAVVDGRRGPLLLDVKLDPETIPRHK